MDFYSYNLTYIQGFTSILAAYFSKNRMLWVFTTASKKSSVRIICSILTTLKNEQHPCRRVRVYEDGTFKNSTYFTNPIFDDFIIAMETTGGDASWINRKSEHQTIDIHNMVRSGLLDSNQHENK